MIIFTAMIDNPEDQSKFVLLYETYKSSLYAVAYDVVKNEFDAEDIVQQSMLKIIKILSDIEMDALKEKSTKNLLITITKNTALDLYRKRKRECEVLETLPPNKSFKNVEDIIIENSDYQNLIEVIESMDEKYREVLRLRCMHHLTPKETSEVLNITEMNVNTRLTRARKILMEKLKELKDE